MADETALLVRIEATTTKLEAAMKRATKLVSDGSNSMTRALDKSNKRVSDGLAQSARGFTRLGQVTGAQRFVLQNTANQIGDIAVQLEGGTSAMRVFGQQVPQILGGFGALGGSLALIAPLLGTIFAIGAPLAAVWLSNATNAKSFDDQIKELSGAVADYEKAITAASIPTGELSEKYGRATEAARVFLDTLSQIAKVNSIEKLNATMDGLVARFGAVSKAGAGALGRRAEEVGAAAARLAEISRLLESGAGGLQAEDLRVEAANLTKELGDLVGFVEGVDALGGSFAITAQQAADLAAAVAQLGEAKGPEEQAKAAEALQRAMVAAFGPVSDMPPEARKIAEELARAGEEAANLAGLSGRVNFDAAASSASALADQLTRAVGAAQDLAAASVSDLQRARINYEFRDDPIGRAGALAHAEFDARTPTPEGADSTILNVLEKQRRAYVANAVEAARYNELLAETRTGKSSRGGGGGGARGAEQQSLFAPSEAEIARLQMQIESVGLTIGQTAELTAQTNLLNEAKKRGLDLDALQAETGLTLRQEIEAQAARIGELTQAYSQAQQQAQFFEGIQNQLVDGFLDAIIEGKNLAGVFANLAREIAKAALQAALFGKGPFAGLFGGSNGGLFGGLFGGFAAGGYTGDGMKHSPAGIVHRGEYVFSQDAVRRIGVANLEALHKGLKGYASGGMVGSAAAPVVQSNTTVANFVDPQLFEDFVASHRGERVIANVLTRLGVGVG